MFDRERAECLDIFPLRGHLALCKLVNAIVHLDVHCIELRSRASFGQSAANRTCRIPPLAISDRISSCGSTETLSPSQGTVYIAQEHQ